MCYFIFLCVIKLKDGNRNTRLCNMFGLRDLCCQM